MTVSMKIQLPGTAPAPAGAPRHRREMPHWVENTDAMQNDARCINIGSRHCGGRICPRHDPADYADYMARHATDSIFPVDRDPWSGKS